MAIVAPVENTHIVSNESAIAIPDLVQVHGHAAEWEGNVGRLWWWRVPSV